ncbi:MAG: D-alanyl-D-alanine carboxypeptidase [Desulfocapsa sp.]|nr:MAG: D-alanyl-D-alanine carboxypeptidase [Desulfocapsa sp.]
MYTDYKSYTRVLLLFCAVFLLVFSSAFAAVPTFSDSTKWKVEQKNMHSAATAPIMLAAATPPRATARTRPVLGKAYDISNVKKRLSPLVTTKTTKRLNRKISSRCAIIIDAVSGKTLYSRNPDTQRQPASTIKVITGMIALKSLDNAEKVAVSKKAARQPRSKVYLDQKKTYRANDLINAVLLASANDASVAIAEKIAGSEKKFAQMMTLRASLWGATNTVCKTATGLTAKGQKTTARDLATIFRYAMQDPDFSKRMKRVKVRTTNGKLLRNHNKALWQVKGTLGGKTGYTNAARQTYVGKFKRGSDEIIVAIMGSETMWSDIKRLVEYGFKKKVAMHKELHKQHSAIKLVAEL